MANSKPVTAAGINSEGVPTVPQDYTSNKIPWWETLPSTSAGVQGLGQIAPEFQGNAKIGTLNPQITSMYPTWQQEENTLSKGPGNAFSKSDMTNFATKTIGDLQNSNKQAMQGYAGSSSGRGIAGNNLGGILGQQLAVSNAGALANSQWQAKLAGLDLGNTQYNSLRGAAGDLGGVLGVQSGIDAQNYGKSKQNAYDMWQQAQKDLNDYMTNYAQQLFVTSGQGGGMGDQAKDYYRAVYQNKKNYALQMMKEYQKFDQTQQDVTQSYPPSQIGHTV